MATPSAAVHPLAQIGIGLVLGLAAFGVPMACGAGGTLTPLMQCKLDALRVLPTDPLMVTVFDSVDMVERINACHRTGADGADGGP